jgi:HNH endonuclease
MPRSYISAELRRLVAQRADYSCEYCLIAEKNTPSCQVDHIISVKHGGDSTAENLCYACLFCNLQKGTDLGSINWRNGELVRFFNPRRDSWRGHFQIDGAIIRSTTDIGEVTVRILDFNDADRILERQILIENDRYPSAAAKKSIG